MPSNLQSPPIKEARRLRPDAPVSSVEPRLANKATQAQSHVGSPTGRGMRLCYLSGDLLAISMALIGGKLVGSWIMGELWSPWTLVELKFFGLFAVSMLAVAVSCRSYSPVPPRPARQFRGWTIGTLAVVSVLILGDWMFSLSVESIIPEILVAATIAHLSACFLRALCRIVFGRKSWWGTRVLVIGCGEDARNTMRYLLKEPQWGIRPVGYLTENSSEQALDVRLPRLGTLNDMDQVAKKTGVIRALVALDSLSFSDLRPQFYRPDAVIRHWIVIPSLDFFTVLWSEWNETARLPAVTVSNHLASPTRRRMKRCFDLVATSMIAVALLPLIVTLALIVKLTSKGPVFYKHRRIGRHGDVFYPWKFRTMVKDADAVLERYLEDNEDLREEWEKYEKLKNDPRITAVGRFLRATSLDELPQIWNVLKGEMSLVGPRPIVAKEAQRFHAVFGHYEHVVPGITGLWQVSGRNETSSKERIDLDIYYVENWSIWLDMYILACTVKVVLLREGAY